MGTKRERILQKLNPMLLRMTPKLSGDTGSFIDLDSKDSLEEGAKKLMMRFFRNQDLCDKSRKNTSRNDTEVTISSAKYNENKEICELITERLSLPLLGNEDDDVLERPGGRLQKLKKELQEKMSAKWEEEYKKRISENESFGSRHKEKKKKSHSHLSSQKSETGDENDAAGEFDKGENSDDGDEADVESEEEENEFDKDPSTCDNEENFNRKDSFKNKEKTPEKSYEFDDSETCSLVPAYQPGGGLLYGGSELTQGDEGLPQNLLSPSLRINVNESPGSKLQLESSNDRTPKKAKSILNEEGDSLFTQKSKLFSQNPNNSFDLNDAFEFCSGKFPDADEAGIPEVAEENSDEEGDEDAENEEEFEGEEKEDNEVQNLFDEGSTDSEPEESIPKTRKNIVAFEDSEEEEEIEKETEKNELCLETEETLAGAPKLLSDDEDEAVVEGDTKPKKKIRKNLHFSDEEDTSSDHEDGEDEKEQNDSDQSEKGDDDLDNEEEDCDNRSVHYDSEENEIINPKEFFEKEAELSGSEWSGDEDERGLDELDVEEGDADNLDSSLVRSQLEKIHIRRVLDDDAREVRLIQEILFEDGDLHSDGKRRDRKFKWKNLGTFDEEGNDGQSKEEGGNSSEDDCAAEEEQRKLRYEKELFFMSKKKSGDDSSDEELISDVQVVKVSRVKASGSAERKTERSKAIMDFTKIANNSLIPNARGSFLTRNEEFLSRLAKATSSVSDNLTGPKNSRNFVFAPKSPEKINSERSTASKRLVEDAGSCGRQEKRMKVLPREVDTGPSILDLLV